MSQKNQKNIQVGGVSIDGTANVGGDIVGGNQVFHGDSVKTITDNKLGNKDASAELVRAISEWQSLVNNRIDALMQMSKEDKNDIKEQVSKIKDEALKQNVSNPARLEKLINILAAMGPDIFDVVVTTLSNPLAGIGLTIKKISERAVKVEKVS